MLGLLAALAAVLVAITCVPHAIRPLAISIRIAPIDGAMSPLPISRRNQSFVQSVSNSTHGDRRLATGLET
jgi:hypothetical protein